MVKRKKQETQTSGKKNKPDRTLEVEESVIEEDFLDVEPVSPSKAYAKPTVDFTFKKLFGNEHNKPLTINFLNSVFGFESYEAIKEISFENTFHKRLKEEKMSILDVFCTDTKGRQFIIEVQQQKLVAFEKRVQYYAHKVHSSQLSTNSDYSDIRAVYTLVICDFKVFPSEVPCISHHVTMETETKKIFLKETRYTFIELPKFQHQKNEKLVLKDQWVYMLKNYQQGPPENAEKLINDAFTILEMEKWTKEEIRQYEKQLKENEEFKSKLEEAEEKGRKEGIAIGEEKGKEEGREEGKVEMAIGMIKRDMKPTDVMDISGLLKEKVKELYLKHSDLPKEEIEIV
jgi:predicted transposase/invertase (TIGR01784 family)